ncbi:MAG: hypothetical protein HQ536_02290, partial [Parcubacteria group bacterium]|nr:hypothetical protein [Parcubacteria group bacterium]
MEAPPIEKLTSQIDRKSEEEKESMEFEKYLSRRLVEIEKEGLEGSKKTSDRTLMETTRPEFREFIKDGNIYGLTSLNPDGEFYKNSKRELKREIKEKKKQVKFYQKRKLKGESISHFNYGMSKLEWLQRKLKGFEEAEKRPIIGKLAKELSRVSHGITEREHFRTRKIMAVLLKEVSYTQEELEEMEPKGEDILERAEGNPGAIRVLHDLLSRKGPEIYE